METNFWSLVKFRILERTLWCHVEALGSLSVWKREWKEVQIPASIRKCLKSNSILRGMILGHSGRFLDPSENISLSPPAASHETIVGLNYEALSAHKLAKSLLREQ